MAALACEEHPQLCVRAKLQASVSPLSASETLIFYVSVAKPGSKKYYTPLHALWWNVPQ